MLEKTLNLVFTLIIIILLLYLITIFVYEIVDRRVNNVEIRLPKQNINNKNQNGGFTVYPASIPVPVIEPDNILTVKNVIPTNYVAALPTIQPITVPFGSIPAATKEAAITVINSNQKGGDLNKQEVFVEAGAMTPGSVPITPVVTEPAVTEPAVTETVVTVPPVAPVTETVVAPVTEVVPVVTPVTPVVTPVTEVVTPVIATKTNTYYKHPNDMTVEQRKKFKEQASFAKMTLDDYRNWLSLWVNDETNLVKIFPAHIPNFRKYISGLPVLQSDLQLVVTSVIMPVAVKTPGLDTAQGLYNRFFLGNQYMGLYPESFAQYPSVTTIPVQTTPLPVVIS